MPLPFSYPLQKYHIFMVFTLAGILAGMWPCGILVLLSELFTSESKSQVFASLHELLKDWDGIQSSLSRCLCNTCIMTLLCMHNCEYIFYH